MIRALVAAALVAAAPTVAFTIRDPRITEASGIAPGLRSPGVIYVQNDSGDSNRFFALDARTGATAATVRVPGAENVDWEDLAVATDADGTPSVWLADTGDNDANRAEVRVYRVAEPGLDPTARDRAVTTGEPDVWRLRYPTGPADVESLAVAPGGAAYLVTKSLTGASVVYLLPSSPDARRVQKPTRVAALTFTFTGTPGGPNAIGQLTATGAAFSRNGDFFAVRTYTDAYLWAVTDGDLAGALRAKPVRVPLPRQPQGEGIAFGTGTLLIDSEGTDQPVYDVDVQLPAPGTASITQTRTGGVPISQSEPDDGDRSGSDTVRYLVGGAVVIAGASVVLAISRRRRH